MTISTTDEARAPTSALVAITAAEEAAFRRDGFLLLRGVLPLNEVETLLAEVDRLVREASRKGSVLREPYYHENSFKLVRILRLSQDFDRLVDHPGYFGRLVSLIGSHIQLMGSEIFVRGASDGDITGFHTDCGPGLQAVLPDDENAFLQVKAQLFLTDLSRPDTSNFALIPGSHRRRPSDHNPSCMLDSVNARMGPNGELPGEAVQVLANAGDVLLFPHSLWHAVARNDAGRTRYSIALRYGLTGLRPMERFDPVLADPTRTLTPRQRRLLGDYGVDGTSPYRPPGQDAIILNGADDDTKRVSTAAYGAPTGARPRQHAAAAESVVAVAREALDAACPRYICALAATVGEQPLPCGTQVYAQMFASASESAQWTVLSLLRHAASAGDEARCLWDMASCCEDPTVRAELERAARDQSNHVLSCVDLTDVAFPGALSPQFGDEVRALAPGLDALPVVDARGDAVATEAIASLNLAGLRTAILIDLQRQPILERCDADGRARAAELISGLKRDALRQVAWTARRLEAAAERQEAGALASLLDRCVRVFIRQTSEEAVDLSYHQRFGSHP